MPVTVSVSTDEGEATLAMVEGFQANEDMNEDYPIPSRVKAPTLYSNGPENHAASISADVPDSPDPPTESGEQGDKSVAGNRLTIMKSLKEVSQH